jgi:hypothetical protein
MTMSEEYFITYRCLLPRNGVITKEVDGTGVTNSLALKNCVDELIDLDEFPGWENGEHGLEIGTAEIQHFISDDGGKESLVGEEWESRDDDTYATFGRM